MYIRHILTYVVITFERHSLPFNEKFVLKIAKDFEMDQNNYWISLMSILFCLFDSMRFLCLCVLCVLKFCKLSIENQNHTLGRFCCFFSLWILISFASFHLLNSFIPAFWMAYVCIIWKSYYDWLYILLFLSLIKLLERETAS